MRRTPVAAGTVSGGIGRGESDGQLRGESDAWRVPLGRRMSATRLFVHESTARLIRTAGGST